VKLADIVRSCKR